MNIPGGREGRAWSKIIVRGGGQQGFSDLQPLGFGGGGAVAVSTINALDPAIEIAFFFSGLELVG